MVRWPSQIETGSVNDSNVGLIDLYPTILEAVGLQAPADHIVDGETIVPVLKQTGRLKRQAYFTWFPHLIPAVSAPWGQNSQPALKLFDNLSVTDRIRIDIGTSK